jgi:L-seryl-tRNA(Ser) seleniumtransferase
MVPTGTDSSGVDVNDPRRSIPSVELLLETGEFEALLLAHPRSLVVSQLRDEMARVRRDVADGALAPEDVESVAPYADAVRRRLAAVLTPSLRPVINGTGVVLHTNLGRAPLAASAVEAMAGAQGYTNLEYDVDTGTRGSRYDHCSELLCELSGAEDALVVNNGAGALVLALSTEARGRHALVSRGELVEIGGGFRIPEVMESSGAFLFEVGSTNRTRIEDYREAMAQGDVALILKVHRSNFRITGFTEEPDLLDLAQLGKEHGVGVVHDLGSGLMVDAAQLGLPEEPRPTDSLAAGVDVVAFSGDKLLGGPQAGILVGKKDRIARMRRNPLCRALRVDKTTLLALEATLRLYREPARALREIPTLAMLSADQETLRNRADTLAAELFTKGVVVDVAELSSVVGGGTFPEVELPSFGLRVQPVGGAEELARAARSALPPLIGRVDDETLLIDLRTVLDWQDTEVVRIVTECVAP